MDKNCLVLIGKLMAMLIINKNEKILNYKDIKLIDQFNCFILVLENDTKYKIEITSFDEKNHLTNR